MSHTPLGEICVSLGLLRPVDVEQVLARLADGAVGAGMRFGELAVAMGLLDEAGLARALAQQFRLNLVPDDRVERLQIGPDVVALLPPQLMRERLLVPTFLDPEKRVLSLLTADPTDLPALRQVQAAANALRLRLFVASKPALRRLLERAVPQVGAVEAAGAPRRLTELREVDPNEPLTIVVETHAELGSAVRRMDALEGGNAEVVSDPDAVAALLPADRPVCIFFRRAIARSLEPYIVGWRRTCPGLRVCAVDAFGVGGRSAIPEERSRHFFLGLLEFLLLAGEGRQMDARARVRRTARICAALSEELDLRPEERDAVQLGALFADLDELSIVSGVLDTQDEGRRFALALTVLRQFDPPWDLAELFTAVERRLSGQDGPGRDVRVEILYTARAAVRAAVLDGGDLVQALGAEAARHDARVLRALAQVLRRQGLRHQVAAGGGGSSAVVLAEREAAVLTALEARLGAAGFDVVVAADGEQAAQLARNLVPAAIIANQRLPRKDGISLLLELRRADATRHVPVILLTDKGGARDVARGLELGAEDVLEKPIHPDVVVAKLRRAVARRPQSTVGISGTLADLSLVDLLQTLTLGGKTAVVQVTGVGEPGGIQVRDGQIVAGQYGRRTGEEALFSMATLSEGRFEVRFEDSGATNIHGVSEFLLLEALRRRDEARAEMSG
ncbi:MAG: response regulator [Deltaproteobacteria bacterium]|nr:response regulator [Deltaproteobacteria bacterium]